MLKKNLSKSALVVALLTTTVIWRGTTAYAEDPNQAFTLDPMIVTAQRTETRDLDTPATTNIITEQNIKEAGYKNVFDAIEHQVGLTSTGYGDAGQDFGFSSGRTVIRGYDRGTLVMVDGIPMNLKNYNSLDGIPIDMVQQIEIIKGAAGTLYGSEAMGGVINIVTKRPTKANVQASFGKSSFGGYKGSLQINAPLGGGALMVSINRDQSEGDFKYKNFDNDRTYKERLQYYYKDLENTTNRINKQISYDVGFGMEEPSLGKVTSIDEMVTRCAPGGDIYEVFWKQNPDDYGGKDAMEHDWEFYYAKYADPNYKENLYKSDQYQLDKLESAERWRKANDYKNTDAIINGRMTTGWLKLPGKISDGICRILLIIITPHFGLWIRIGQ